MERNCYIALSTAEDIRNGKRDFSFGFAGSLEQALQDTLGDCIPELVRPRRLSRDLCMFVDDEGAVKGLSKSPLASYLYGADEHGNFIYGRAVIVGFGYEDMPLLTGPEAEEAVRLLRDIMHGRA